MKHYFEYIPGQEEGFHLDTQDEIIASHFERLFIFFDTFHEDSKLSLLQAESAFRSDAFQRSPTAFTAYQWAVDRLSTSGSCGGSISALPTILCFLLRELGGFSYTEIGEMVGIDEMDVKRHIAAARHYLLGGATNARA